MKEIFKKIHVIFSTFLFDPLRLIANWRAFPNYIVNFRKYNRLNKKSGTPFKANLKGFYFTTNDKYLPAGSINNHYFFQDMWAAKKLFNDGVKKHVDVGSRIDGFVAHILPFCNVDYVDIRELEKVDEKLNFIQGSILDLPYDSNSIISLSCLHVIEHIGLGRYGDPIDPEGYITAAKELSRVLSVDGTLYFSTPTGQENLYFDAHRVFNPNTISAIFHDLDLLSFDFIDDKSKGINYNASFNDVLDLKYGCGLYKFTKRKATV